MAEKMSKTHAGSQMKWDQDLAWLRDNYDEVFDMKRRLAEPSRALDDLVFVGDDAVLAAKCVDFVMGYALHAGPDDA